MHSQRDQMFNPKQAARRAGISEALLLLWVATGKIKPSLELTADKHALIGDSKKALESFAPEGHHFPLQFNRAAVEELRRMVVETSERKVKTESAHVKGSHFTVQELAALWGFGVDKVRELFENEPGVIKLQSAPKKGKRRYTTLRIPENVAERVQRRNS